MEKGRYPSDEMLGSRFWNGSRMKETLTMSFSGRLFCKELELAGCFHVMIRG
jgi:hypothetical protein